MLSTASVVLAIDSIMPFSANNRLSISRSVSHSYTVLVKLRYSA